MKEKDVERLAALLSKTPEDVNTALEGDGISGLLDEFESDKVVYTKDDFGKFKENFKGEVEREWATGKIPKSLYDKAKGLALEVVEKGIAEKHGIDEWNGLDGLVDKISSKQAKNPEIVAELKGQIDSLTTDYESKIKSLETLNDQRFVDSKVNELINSVPIKAEGKVLANQRKVLKTMVNSEIEFEVIGNDVVIKNAPVDYKQNNLDPKPLQEVINDLAKDYVALSPANGGRGDISSTNTSKKVNFEEYCKEHSIKPNSPELAAAVKKFKDAGVEIV